MVKPPRKLKYVEDYYIRTLLNKVPLKDVMTSPVISIRVDAPFHEAAEKIIKNHIRHLPVVDEKQRLVGLITERDLYKIQSPRRLEDGTWYFDPEMLDNFILKSVMIQDPASLTPENSVAEAIVRMAQSKYGCMLVAAADKTLVGILSYVDLLEFAAQIITEK